MELTTDDARLVLTLITSAFEGGAMQGKGAIEAARRLLQLEEKIRGFLKVKEVKNERNEPVPAGG